MAAINTNYIGVYDGTTYATTALASELVMHRDFENVFFDEYPLVRAVKERGKFNRGYSVEGFRFILPVLMEDSSTVANGVLPANELTQPTPSHIIGLTQAQYNFAHYIQPMWIKNSDKKLGMGARANRGDLMQGALLQTMNSFALALSGDLMGSSVDTLDAVLGVRYLLSTSNSPGNISQTTYTKWAAKVTTSAGTFSLDIINDLYDLASRGSQRPDMLFASAASGNNIYGKLRAQIQPAQQLQTTSTTAQYGFADLKYLTMDVVKDDAGTSGEALGLNTSSLYWVGDTRPKLDNSGSWPGTDAQVMVHNMWCGFGTDNPRLNFKATGLT